MSFRCVKRAWFGRHFAVCTLAENNAFRLPWSAFSVHFLIQKTGLESLVKREIGSSRGPEFHAQKPEQPPTKLTA